MSCRSIINLRVMCGCVGQSDGGGVSPMDVRVNGTAIPGHEIASQMRHHPA